MDDNTTHTIGTAHSDSRKFRRSSENRMIAGVCGGTAALFGVDATLVRVFLIAATLLGFGTGFLVYLACWLIVPEA